MELGKRAVINVLLAHLSAMRSPESKIEHIFEEASSFGVPDRSHLGYIDATTCCPHCDELVDVELTEREVMREFGRDDSEDLELLADELYTQSLVLRVHLDNMKIDLVEAIRQIEEAPEWVKSWRQFWRAVQRWLARPVFAAT